MGCCEGSCSCGKGKQAPVRENQSMIQMTPGQGMWSAEDLIQGLGSFKVKEEVVEVRFKNMRKDFFRNPQGFRLKKDDRVVVEAEGGFDLGTIILTGELAEKQVEQKHNTQKKHSLKQIYRKATEVDLEKWLSAKKRERTVLLESRIIAAKLNQEISIGDVEFQGDGNKLTVYYTANDGLDYRTLIKEYKAAFRARIEMKQIHTRKITSSNNSVRSGYIFT